VTVLVGRRAVGSVSPAAGVSPESLAGIALAAIGRALDEAGAVGHHQDTKTRRARA
jgi:hypothetical protein